MMQLDREDASGVSGVSFRIYSIKFGKNFQKIFFVYCGIPQYQIPNVLPAIRQLHIFLSISSTIFKCLEHCKVGLCPHVPKNVAKLWTLELFSSPTSRSCVVSTTKVIQQLKTRVVTCSRINCYVFKVYWSAGTQINEPIDWGTITRKWKTILGFSSPLKSMVSYRDYIRRM